MTFYNILFGILFLGACRELFQAGFQRRWGEFFVAATIAMLVFNDTLFTSHEVESLKLTYSVWMKLIDLLDFLLLMAAILILSPERNFLGIEIKGKLNTIHREPVIWILLTIYWFLGLAWNKLGNLYSPGFGYREWLSSAVLVPFVLMTILSTSRWKRVAKVSRLLIILIILGYILFKAYAYY